MSRLIDLTNQRFGRLVVVSRAENSGKAVRWNCLCDCGKEIIAYGTNLRRGLTQSCGCYRKDKLREDKFQDITGNKYGHLTVLGLHHRDENTRQYYWNCQCDCGGQVVVYGGHLKDGHTQSCGCLISKGEKKITDLLLQNNIPFVKQYSFNDCRGLNDGLLRFDFAIFDKTGLSYLIEYDGWQHSNKTDSKWDRNGAFESRQEHDKIKNEFCAKNHIPLIRITSNQYKNLTIQDLILKEGD